VMGGRGRGNSDGEGQGNSSSNNNRKNCWTLPDVIIIVGRYYVHFNPQQKEHGSIIDG
jgi:hypothetical protein